MGALEKTLCATVLIACAGCNQFFDLRETSLPPADAAPFCPASGPPPISRRLVQIATGNCFEYSFSEITRRGLAQCPTGDPPGYEIREGPLDGELEPTTFPLPTGLSFAYPRLSADGTEAWLFDFVARQFLVYRRVREQEWAFDRNVTGINETREAGVIALVDGPDGRRLLVELSPNASLMEIVERSDDGSGTWSTVTSRTTLADLGIDFFARIGSSPDGRRIVFAGERDSRVELFYAERPTPDVAFSAAVPLPNVPIEYDTPYMLNSDCSHLYFSAIGSVFYASQ
jgi:hypothetical protein